MSFFGKTKGVQCRTNEDGSKTCDVFEVDGNSKVATGTSFSVAVDNSCTPMLIGDSSITDEDEEIVAKTMKSVAQGCKRGIA